MRIDTDKSQNRTRTSKKTSSRARGTSGASESARDLRRSGKGTISSRGRIDGGPPEESGWIAIKRVNLEGIHRPSRVIIDRIKPEIDGGRYAAKRFIDEPVAISAILLVDGHEHVKGRLFFRHEDEPKASSVPLVSKGNDEWVGEFRAEKLGRYFVSVEAGIDRFDTWKSDITKKAEAGQNITVDLQTGILLLEGWLKNEFAQGKEPSTNQKLWIAQKNFLHEKRRALLDFLQSAQAAIRAGSSIEVTKLKALISDPALAAIAQDIYDEASRVHYAREVPIQVEPPLARFSAWYEFFPRSCAKEPGRHGTLRDAAERLEYVKEMGFDIVYFPPIHPIGMAFRKGKNNSLTPDADDVGSPWAIGGAEGGHTDIHPDLGTFDDFDHLISRAQQLGLEIALDIAFQCSPDHPYVKEHPEWFKKRPDGTIQYAENPPKKYQDIYPFDFETSDWRALWAELKDVVQFWVDRGVKVFRVDNPHTKPFHFWEWLIREVRANHPDVMFLAEAFTRPHIMAYLAKAGFSQSYTYFTWRNTKWELTHYLTELTQTELVDTFGANFWPNTPDILPEPLQEPNRAVYMQRLVLAATMSGNYGIYGPPFELLQNAPRHEGSEEYLDSEKYQLREWNLDDPSSLAPFIRRVNEIRRSNKALQNTRSLKFHSVSNDSLIAFSKTAQLENGEEERVLVVVNLDPHHVHSGLVELPLLDWKIDPSETFQVHDLLTDARYYWSGWRNYVELNPESLPAHIFVVRKRTLGASDFDYFV